MINLDDVIGENKQVHDLHWPYIPDYLYRVLIADSSGLGKQTHYSMNQMLIKNICMLSIHIRETINIS